MTPYPDKVRLVEVGPRDGLQNEATLVEPAVKIKLIQMLVDAGLQYVEAGSFVSPKWVPQMASSAEVLEAVRGYGDAVYPVLTPNMVGLNAALASGAEEIAVFAAASETFSQKNINCSIDESLERLKKVAQTALAKGLRVRGYVSCVLGCPYQGEIPVSEVARVALALADIGCYEISLGDTIGCGTPLQAQAMVQEVSEHVAVEHLAVHFHDTYGQGLANLLAVLPLGVTVIDTSVSGLGGCPYAKGASGNVATEDVLYMLHGMGIETGVDLNAVIRAGSYISEQLGRPAASHLGQIETLAG